MNKKLVLAILTVFIATNIGFISVYADSTSDKSKIKQVQTQRNDLENKVDLIDQQIVTSMSKINSNANDITVTQEKIKETQINIDKAEADIQSEEVVFDKRMRSMYVNGTSSYIEIILGSEGLDDFISRVKNVKLIVAYDKEVINDFNTKKAAINSKKVELDKENTRLIALSVDNKKKLAALTKQKSDQTVLLVQLQAQENQSRAQLATDTAAEAKQAADAKQAAEATQFALATQQSIINTGFASSSGNTAKSPVNAPISRGGDAGSYKNILNVRATAYDPSNSTSQYTASGKPVEWNPSGYSTIAVDPSVIPLGTRVYVEGYGLAYAADTGGAIKGNTIDVFFNTPNESRSWGVRYVKVYILK